MSLLGSVELKHRLQPDSMAAHDPADVQSRHLGHESAATAPWRHRYLTDLISNDQVKIAQQHDRKGKYHHDTNARLHTEHDQLSAPRRCWLCFGILKNMTTKRREKEEPKMAMPSRQVTPLYMYMGGRRFTTQNPPVVKSRFMRETAPKCGWLRIHFPQLLITRNEWREEETLMRYADARDPVTLSYNPSRQMTPPDLYLGQKRYVSDGPKVLRMRLTREVKRKCGERAAAHRRARRQWLASDTEEVISEMSVQAQPSDASINEGSQRFGTETPRSWIAPGKYFEDPMKRILMVKELESTTRYRNASTPALPPQPYYSSFKSFSQPGAWFKVEENASLGSSHLRANAAKEGKDPDIATEINHHRSNSSSTQSGFFEYVTAEQEADKRLQATKQLIEARTRRRPGVWKCVERRATKVKRLFSEQRILKVGLQISIAARGWW